MSQAILPQVLEVAAPARLGNRPGAARLTSLDGLRAVAVFGVMAVHAGVPGFELGWLGVEVFFVLSGFLITSLLLGEFEKRGKISFFRFWVRRGLRLLPVYWFYVAAVSVAVVASPPDSVHTHGGWTPGWYLASLWCYFVNHCPLGGVWEHQWLTLHLWSLSVEMQFYFVWPLVLAACLSYAGPRLAAIAGLLISIASGVCLLHLIPDGEVRQSLSSRGFAITLGASAALCAGYSQVRSAVARKGVGDIAVAAGVLVVVLGTLAFRMGRVPEISLHRYLAALVSVITAYIVLRLWRNSPWWLSTVLQWRPLRYAGEISYGIYLYHIAVSWLIWTLVPQLTAFQSKYAKFGVRLLLYFGLTILIAHLSYQFIERPCLKLKDRFQA